jgi:hypothetical protein
VTGAVTGVEPASDGAVTAVTVVRGDGRGGGWGWEAQIAVWPVARLSPTSEAVTPVTAVTTLYAHTVRLSRGLCCSAPKARATTVPMQASCHKRFTRACTSHLHGNTLPYTRNASNVPTHFTPNKALTPETERFRSRFPRVARRYYFKIAKRKRDPRVFPDLYYIPAP